MLDLMWLGWIEKQVRNRHLRISSVCAVLFSGCTDNNDEARSAVPDEGPRSGMGEVRIAATKANDQAPAPAQGGCLERTRVAAKNASLPGSDACYQRYDAVGAVTSGKERVCLGTLIGAKTVLTAAHCVEAQVELGFATGCWLDHALSLMRVAHVEKHPEFRNAEGKHSPEHDIALLCLGEALSAAPIALARRTLSESDINANQLVFMGYGPAPYLDEPPMMRRKATMKIRRPAEEQAFYFDEPRVAVWPYDSGGPVLLSQTTGLEILGVVSLGDENDHCPKAATRVDKHRDWILTKAQELCGDAL